MGSGATKKNVPPSGRKKSIFALPGNVVFLSAVNEESHRTSTDRTLEEYNYWSIFANFPYDELGFAVSLLSEHKRKRQSSENNKEESKSIKGLENFFPYLLGASIPSKLRKEEDYHILFKGSSESRAFFEGKKAKYESEFEVQGLTFLCEQGEVNDYSKDNLFIFTSSDFRIYGIFNGHGPFGDEISSFVQSRIAYYIFNKNIQKWGGRMHEKFKKYFEIVSQELTEEVQKQEIKQQEGKTWDVILSGVSATIILHHVKLGKLTVAYSGNSTPILGDKSGNLHNLIHPHSPDNWNEMKRIYAMGGEVTQFQKGDRPRVCIRGRNYPALTTTRSIGDYLGRQIGVSQEPQIEEHALPNNKDLVLVIATETLWNYIKPLDVFDSLFLYGPKDVKDAGRNIYNLVKKACPPGQMEDLAFIIVFL